MRFSVAIYQVLLKVIYTMYINILDIIPKFYLELITLVSSRYRLRPFFKIQLPVIKAINIYWQRTKWRQNAIFANTACKDIRTTKERWQQSLPSPAMVNVVVIIVAVVIGFFLFKESQYVYICAFLSKIEHLKCRFYEIFHTFNNMQKGNMYLQE